MYDNFGKSTVVHLAKVDIFSRQQTGRPEKFSRQQICHNGAIEKKWEKNLEKNIFEQNHVRSINFKYLHGHKVPSDLH